MFFDPAVAEPTATPSIAELMARHGVKSDSLGVAPPVEGSAAPEKKEETAKPDESPKSVEPTDKTQGEPAKSETPSQPKEQPKVETTPAASQPQKAPTLQEVLRNHQPNAVLKELGYDDSVVAFLSGIKDIDPKMVNFLNHWKNNGDLTPYFKALTTDYSKMSAENVMRHYLREEYPTASDQQIEALYKKEIVQAYNLNSPDEDEAAEGRLLLEAKAEKFRQDLANKQQQYLFPKPQEPTHTAPDPVQVQQEKDFELYQQYISDSPLIKDMVANNSLAIGSGETAYKHPLGDAKQVVDSLIDPDAYAKSFFSKETRPDGSTLWVPNMEKLLFVHAALSDFEGFKKGWADHYIKIGKEAAIAPIENAKEADKGQPSKSEAPPKSAAEAMARQGRYNPGG